MKQITRYILVLAAIILSSTGAMANNTATVIKQIDGAAAGTTDPGSVTYSSGTITVTPAYGYYLTVADLTVVKTIDGQYAEARRRAPGINIPVAVTATDPSADPSKKTTYTFVATDANYDYEITANFHTRTDISGATVTVATTSYMYDGTAQQPAVTVTLGGTTLTKGTDYDVYYADSINAGTGKITIVGTRTYKGTNTSAVYTINRIAGSVSYATTSIDKTTIEEAFTNELTKTGDGTVSYSSSDPTVATVNTTSGQVTIVGAGQTVIQVTVADGTNYTYATNTATYTLNVTNAAMNVTASGYDGAYDGMAHGITVSAPDGATVTYGTKAGTYDLNASPTYTDAGVYTVYYQVTKPKFITVTGSETVTITKFNAMLQFADYEVTAKIGEDFTPPTLTVNPANLPVTYSSSNTDIATVDAQTGEVTLVAPGKVNISAVFDGDANYYPASDFYILTVLHADIEPIDKDVVYTFDDEHFLYTDDEGNVKERKLDNTIIFDILFTLDTSGDPSESDGYDETEHCIVLNHEMPDSRLYNVNFMDLEPGSEEYAEEYIGLTFKVPAGTGYIIIDSKTDGEHWMKVQIGDLAPVSYCHTDREKDYIRYDCDRETWVHVYNGGPVNNSARMLASHRAKKQKGQVRIYSITRSSSSTIPDGIEYINAESFDGADKWYDLQGNRIERPVKKGIYILQGQKVIVR